MRQFNGALIKLLINPSMSTAVIWSSVIHVSTVVAAIIWLPVSVSDATLSGKKTVIQFQFAKQISEATDQPQITIAVETAIQQNRPRAESVEPYPIEVAIADFNEPRQIYVQRERIPKREVIKQEAAKSVRLPRKTRVSESIVSLLAIPAVTGTDDKTPPDLSGNRPPTYPSEAIRRRLEGTTMLRMHISVSGQVTRVEIAQSSGHQILDNAALLAVRTWRGQPARANGIAVSTVEFMPVRFRLR